MIDSCGDAKVQMETVDHFFASIPVSFLKMNIMGNVDRVLRGAKGVIRRDAPIIASEAFVSWADLKLPLVMQALLADTGIQYRYYFRNHYAINCGMIFYAIPEAR